MEKKLLLSLIISIILIPSLLYSGAGKSQKKRMPGRERTADRGEEDEGETTPTDTEETNPGNRRRAAPARSRGKTAPASKGKKGTAPAGRGAAGTRGRKMLPEEEVVDSRTALINHLKHAKDLANIIGESELANTLNQHLNRLISTPAAPSA